MNGRDLVIDYVPHKDNLKERGLFSISVPTTTIVFCLFNISVKLIL